MDTFNNQGALMGIGAGVGSHDYQTFAAMIGANNTEIPKEIRDLLSKGDISIRPLMAYRSVILGSSTGAKTFTKSDSKQVGITNIKEGKPLNKEFFMLTAITLLSAEAPGPAEADLKNTLFKPLEETSTHDVIIAGECKLSVGGKVIFDELPNQAFVSKGDTNLTQGLYLLPKPIFVNDSQLMEFEVSLGVATGLTANSALKVILHGLKASVS